jgi:hypothetical protein
MKQPANSEHSMDILFLLTPGFTDSTRDGEGKKYYCPDCAFLEGVLGCCPELRRQLDIRYIAYPRPRREIVEIVGPSSHAFVDASRFHRCGDRLHSTDTKAIVEYLAQRYGVLIAHF